MESIEALSLAGEERSWHNTLWEATVESTPACAAGIVCSSLSAEELMVVCPGTVQIRCKPQCSRLASSLRQLETGLML